MRNADRWREHKGVTQRQMAEKVGVSEPTISKWFNSKASPKLLQLAELAEVLKIPLQVFIFSHPDDDHLQAPLGGKLVQDESVLVLIRKWGNLSAESRDSVMTVINRLLAVEAPLDTSPRETDQITQSRRSKT